MPYATNESVPKHVPSGKRAKWRHVWNSVYKRCRSKKGNDCEAAAFRQANGAALSESIAILLSEVPPGTPKIPAELVVYLELPGAKKDADCLIVEVPGGVSMEHGCCDVWDDIEGENAASFRCGTCLYHSHPEHSTHLSSHSAKRSNLGEGVKDCGPDKKAVGGECVSKADFLMVGDPKKKETWKLPVHDKAHTQNAMARYNQTEGRSPSVASRLVAKARKYGIEVDEFKKHLSESGMKEEEIKLVFSSAPRIFAANLRFSEAIDPALGLYKIPFAHTGTFYKDGEKFKISEEDFDSIVANFGKRENGEVNLDYEHASETPEIAKGQPIPSAGAIKVVTKEKGPDGKPWLYGVLSYTDLAKKLVDSKQYRFFSPAIAWDAEDKQTGEPQGATLTSGALTNRPFLEKLPPLLMSEVPKLCTEETIMPKPKTAGKVTMVEKPAKEQIRLRKIMDATGTHIQACKAGDGEGEASFGELLGEIYPGDFKQLAGAEPGTSTSPSTSTTTTPATSASAAEPSTPATTSTPGATPSTSSHMAEVLGETGIVNLTDVRRTYRAGKEAIRFQDAHQGHKLLSETLKPEGWDKRASRQLLSDGKVTPQQYAAFENAVELVEEGIKAGKIHPANRRYFLTDAIERPQEFEAMLKEARPYVDFEEHGLAGTSGTGRVLGSEHERVEHEAKELVKKEREAGRKMKYADALRKVTATDDSRSRRLREEASGKVLM